MPEGVQIGGTALLLCIGMQRDYGINRSNCVRLCAFP